MSKLIDRKESLIFNGSRYDFTLYWGEDARKGGIFGISPVSVGITKWIKMDCSDFKTIHISVDNSHTDIFWMYEREGLFGKTIWKERIEEDINTITLDKLLSYIPKFAQ